MSKFKTSIPVDVEGITKLLPPGAHVDGVTWDAAAGAVELRWQHDQLKSGLDHAVEFPVDNLREQRVPAGIKPLPIGRPEPSGAELQQAEAEAKELEVPAPTEAPEVTEAARQEPRPTGLDVRTPEAKPVVATRKRR